LRSPVDHRTDGLSQVIYLLAARAPNITSRIMSGI
jgi:hypothetical protein